MKDKMSVEGIFFSLPEDWKEITDQIFEEGGHYTEAFLALGLSAIEHEVVMDADEYMEHFCNGMAKSEAYWFRWARENLNNKDANISLFKAAMDRMFNWSKKLDKLKPEDDSKKRFLMSEKEKYKKKYLQTN